MNIAGVNGRQHGIANVEDIGDDNWDFVLGVNLIGVLNCMRAGINAMKEHGSIVNASSVAGIIGMSKNGAYVASEHAVIGLTRVSAKGLGEEGIRVNAIAPYVFPVLRLSHFKMHREAFLMVHVQIVGPLILQWPGTRARMRFQRYHR